MRSIPYAQVVTSFSFLDDVPKELECIVYITSVHSSGSSQTLGFFSLVKHNWSALQSYVLALDEDGLDYGEFQCIENLTTLSLDELKKKIKGLGKTGGHLD